MPRPKNVKKTYALSFFYIVNYYLNNIDFYDYRSSEGRNAHLSVGLEENGNKLPCLTSTEGTVLYKLVQFPHMKDALLRWLQKRKVFNYVLKECPKSDMYRVKSLVDYLDYK